MKSILKCLTKFRMVFIVLSLIYLSLDVGNLTVQSSVGLFYWNPDPIEEGAGDVTFSASLPASHLPINFFGIVQIGCFENKK